MKLEGDYKKLKVGAEILNLYQNIKYTITNVNTLTSAKDKIYTMSVEPKTFKVRGREVPHKTLEINHSVLITIGWKIL